MPATRPRVGDVELVGRTEELDRLLSSLPSAPGWPRLVVVEGAAGIGKTALVRAAAAALPAGVEVRWSVGEPEAGVPPFWAWRQALGNELPVGDRFALFDHVAQAMSALGDAVLVVDDLPWIDEPSLLVLRHLLRRPLDGRLAVWATVRTGEGDPSALVEQLVSGPDVARIRLRPLDPEASQACLLAAAGGDVEAGLAGLAGGNPLLLRELGRLAALGGSPPAADLAEVLGRRLRHLTGPAQQLLHAAAVLGQEVDLAVLAGVLDLPAMACLPGVDEAVRAGMLVPAAAGRFRFSHALVRDALEAELPLVAVVSLHRRAATALAALHAERPAEVAAEVARHWAAVAVTGERAPALRWALLAADEAERVGAYEESVRLCTSALQTAGPAAPEVVADLLLRRAAAHHASGHVTAALADCREALSRAGDDPELLVRTALTLEPAGDRECDRAIIGWCRAALAVVPDDPRRARLLARLSTACVYADLGDDAAACAVEADAVADRCGDEDALAAALHARQLTSCGPEHLAVVASLGQRMTELGARRGRVQDEMLGRLWTLDALWARGDLTAVELELGGLSACVKAVGTPVARWHLLRARAVLAQGRGELARARELADEALALLAPMGHPAAFGSHMAFLSALGHHAGHDPLSLQVPPEEVREEVRGQLFTHLGPAFALAESGRLDESLTLYLRAGQPTSWRVPQYFQMAMLDIGARLAVLLDRKEDVAWFHEQLLPWRDRHSVGGAGAGAYLGPVSLVLGRCAAVLGEADAAAELLAEALTVCRRNGAAGFAVEAGYELGIVQRRLGRNAEAGRLFAQSHAAAVELGMTPWIARIASELEQDRDPLTVREREVARLVAAGMSNREIAEQLVLSERTAANHVQHILAKLGCSRRSQVAARLAPTPREHPK